MTKLSPRRGKALVSDGEATMKQGSPAAVGGYPVSGSANLGTARQDWWCRVMKS